MKSGVSLFISSMVFGIVIAAIYGFTTRDIIGVLFLSAMALALTVVAAFILVAEREADLAGDRADLEPRDVAGEDLGVFSTESYWPILAAVGTMSVIFGVVYVPGIALGFLIAGVAVVAWTLRFLVREST